MVYQSSQYPTAADLTAFITAAGIDIPASFDPAPPMNAAISEWEERTGWFPFLASSPQTRLFDPPSTGPASGRVSSTRGGRVLDLGAGILNMPDNGLSIGVIASTLGQIGINSQSAGSLGTVLTRNIQYFLRPNNAEFKGKPWTEIEFQSPVFGLPKSIAITATWGRTYTIEAEVWYLILQRAFVNARPILSMYTSGGANKVGDERSSVSFDGGVFTSESDQIDTRFKAAVRRYVRITA